VLFVAAGARVLPACGEVVLTRVQRHAGRPLAASRQLAFRHRRGAACVGQGSGFCAVEGGGAGAAACPLARHDGHTPSSAAAAVAAAALIVASACRSSSPGLHAPAALGRDAMRRVWTLVRFELRQTFTGPIEPDSSLDSTGRESGDGLFVCVGSSRQSPRLPCRPLPRNAAAAPKRSGAAAPTSAQACVRPGRVVRLPAERPSTRQRRVALCCKEGGCRAPRRPRAASGAPPTPLHADHNGDTRRAAAARRAHMPQGGGARGGALPSYASSRRRALVNARCPGAARVGGAACANAALTARLMVLRTRCGAAPRRACLPAGARAPPLARPRTGR
jgi:hypothetical protein